MNRPVFYQQAMRKGEQTRQRIIEQAAALFNRHGYSASSISDVMRLTGLKKGGIYGHFDSKDELAIEAFDFSMRQVGCKLHEALAGEEHAVRRLLALASVFRSLAADSPVPGGCPLLNTAVETDDGPPALRERAQQALCHWQDLVRRTVVEGIERGEIRATTDADQVTTIMIGLLEGAVMMSRLHRDPEPVRHAANHINAYIQRELAAV